MIIDGFDYGDGYVKTVIFDNRIEWWDDDDNTWNRTGHCNQKQMDADLARGHKYRRPMTEAEKQAEKAKEEKVKEENRIPYIYSINTNTKIAGDMPLSEAARIAQLPEVVAEVERQRKEREIKAGDAVYDNEYNRWFVVDHISDGIAFSKTGKDGACCFGGLSALVKVTDEEMKVMEGIKARHVWTAAK